MSINQLITTAIAEKFSALETEEYLNARAARGSRTAFLEALRASPDVDSPMIEDRLD